MSLSVAFVFEVRLTGDDTNGGGFKAGATGTDRSQSDTPWTTLTTASVVHTTTTQLNVNAADYTVTAADVGNAVQIAGGTATAGVYEITAADTVNNRWTVDRALGTAGQTCPGKMGGAFASPGKAASVANSLTALVYIKYNATAYSFTSASSNVSGGVINVGSVTFVGYDTTRTPANTDANRPKLQVNVASATAIIGTSNTVTAQNIWFDGNSQTSAKLSTGSVQFNNCKFTGFTLVGASGAFLSCESTGNSVTIFTGYCFGCEAYGNSAAGFAPGPNAPVVNCLSYGNTGASSDGFLVANSGTQFTGNTAYGNGRDGFRYTDGARFAIFANNISVGNAGYGFNWNTANNWRNAGVNNAAYGNTSGPQNFAAGYELGFVTLTADPFVASGSGNFGLNSTAGGGAALRAAGFPASFPRGLTASFSDIGPAQHQDAGGASGPVGRFISAQRGTPY